MSRDALGFFLSFIVIIFLSMIEAIASRVDLAFFRLFVSI